MQLGEHFTLQEFERTSRLFPNNAPADVIPVLKELCERILEPLRGHFGRPVVITSRYRSPLLNHLIGGAIQNYHVATPDHCAADIEIAGVPLQGVFDWLRKDSHLLFDTVILERGKNKISENDDCVHIQYRSQYPRRPALLGRTHGRGYYVPEQVAACRS